jgi:hypothetical protein
MDTHRAENGQYGNARRTNGPSRGGRGRTGGAGGVHGRVGQHPAKSAGGGWAATVDVHGWGGGGGVYSEGIVWERRAWGLGYQYGGRGTAAPAWQARVAGRRRRGRWSSRKRAGVGAASGGSCDRLRSRAGAAVDGVHGRVRRRRGGWRRRMRAAGLDCGEGGVGGASSEWKGVVQADVCANLMTKIPFAAGKNFWGEEMRGNSSIITSLQQNVCTINK